MYSERYMKLKDEHDARCKKAFMKMLLACILLGAASFAMHLYKTYMHSKKTSTNESYMTIIKEKEEGNKL